MHSLAITTVPVTLGILDRLGLGTIIYLAVLGFLLAVILYKKTLGKDDTPIQDNLAKRIVAQAWKQECHNNWSLSDCTCDPCTTHLHPSSQRSEILDTAWSEAERSENRKNSIFQYTPDVSRAKRFAATLNSDPDCGIVIKDSYM